MNVLALDVGGTSIKSALFRGDALEELPEIPSRGKLGGQALLASLFAAIAASPEHDAIGVSTTGQVDRGSGSISFANENVPGYTGTPLKKLLEERFHKPVTVENDVNAAAIGEGAFGAAKGFSDFLCITFGTGVGGAIVQNGSLYTGANGSAGEFGHSITHAGGLPCGCGQEGCYEQYASATALVRQAVARNPGWTNGRLLFTSFAQGDPVAREVVDAWIDEIVRGLLGLIHTFDPPCVVLGGGVLRQPYVIAQIREKAAQRLMPVYREVLIRAAELGNTAALYGMLEAVRKRGRQ